MPVFERMSHATAMITPVLVGYGLALVTLTIYAKVTGTYGSPPAAWLTALASAIVLASAFGYAVGTLAGSRWYTPPLGAVLFFGFYVALRIAPVPYGVVSLYPVILNVDSVFVRHISLTMWGQTAVFISVALLLLLLAGGGWRPGTALRFGSTVAVLFVSALAGAGAVLATNGQYVTGHNSRDFVCNDSSPSICLNRGYAAAMPDLSSAMKRLNAKVAGTPLEATLIEQNVEGVGDAPSPQARSIYIEEINRFGITFAVSRYVTKYGGASSCEVNEDVENYLSVSIVDAWLSGYDELGIGDFPKNVPGAVEYRAFMSLNDADAHEWLRAHEDEYFSCELSLSDFPT
ncbi:hypothetical protein ACSAGD_14205 [Paramicrobacterium sp. CJ85]|uniref:hypothetical protein n=1 Tax=Paramicrobacterium sp. CJ85 TaxID=3445355 RepID=UPI003F63178F